MEIWRPVVGYEGYYEISNYGRLRSLDRVTYFRRRAELIARRFKGQLISTKSPNGDYPQVHLSRTDNLKKFKVHRKIHELVLEAFVGPRPPGMQGCHFDDIRSNNRLDNLRWDVPKGNSNDAVRNGKIHLASHGTTTRYRTGCRCAECKEAKRRNAHEYHAKTYRLKI